VTTEAKVLCYTTIPSRFILGSESTLENLNEVKIQTASSAITLGACVDQSGEVVVTSTGPHCTPVKIGHASKVSELVPLVKQHLPSLLQEQTLANIEEINAKLSQQDEKLADLERALSLATSTSTSEASIGAQHERTCVKDPDQVMRGIAQCHPTEVKQLWEQLQYHLPTEEELEVLKTQRKSPETPYQDLAIQLFEYLCPRDKKIWNNKYIKDVRPDISVTEARQAALRWDNAVMVAEVETQLSTTTAYHTGLGQAISYTSRALKYQRKRKLIFTLVTCCSHINIIRWEYSDRDMKKRIQYATGIADLLPEPKPAEPTNGFTYLASLLRAPVTSLGLIPTIIPDVITVSDRLFSPKTFLGSGANSRVYSATCAPEPDVVIKLLPAAQSRLFYNEVEALESLQTIPGIPELVCAEDQTSSLFIVTRMVGKPLDNDGVCRASEIYGLMTKVIRTLEQVHARGWYHGDVAPSNIVCVGDHDVQLIDWGLSGRVEKEHRSLFGRLTFLSTRILKAVNAGQAYHYLPTDDMESLGWTMLHLLQGCHLPWEKKQVLIDIIGRREAYYEIIPPAISTYLKLVSKMQQQGGTIDYAQLTTTLSNSTTAPENSPIRCGVRTKKGKICQNNRPCRYASHREHAPRG